MKGNRLLIGFLIFSTSIILIATLPLFKIQHIDITGTRLLSPLLIKEGTSSWKGRHLLFFTFFSHAKQDLKKQFPEIEHCSIRLRSLNKIHCHITEKKPWITILVDGKSHFISEDGTLLSHYQTTQIQIETMLIVRGIAPEEFYNNRHHSWLTSIRPLVALIQNKLYDHVIQLEKNKINQWVLLKDDTLPILLGPLSSVTESPHRIKQVITQLEKFNRPRKSITYIDLRQPPKIIVGYNR
tara:strand:- start:1548 stop:2267 length:720 start_codon:yes stop_codon:yes gene_type:complete